MEGLLRHLGFVTINRRARGGKVEDLLGDLGFVTASRKLWAS